MDKNVLWVQTNSMFRHLSAEEGRMDGEDLVQPLTLLSTMIKSYPSLVAKVEGLDESRDTEHRIQAFSSFIMCKTFHLQSKPKYKEIDKEIFNLQNILLDTLMQYNRVQWKSFMGQLINFTFCLVITRGKHFHLFNELLTNKELEALTREERSGYCRILADLEPEDSLFPNTERLVNLDQSPHDNGDMNECDGDTSLDRSACHLISCSNRIIITYLPEILTNFKNSENMLRKMSLIQTCLPDTNVILQYLDILAHLNTYKVVDFKLVVLEMHVIHELFSQLYSGKFDSTWKSKFEKVLYKYLDKRTEDHVPVCILEAYRNKLLHLITSFIMKKQFKDLEVQYKKVLLNFLNKFLSGGKDMEDEFYLVFIKSSLHNGLASVLVDQSFSQIKGPTRLQARYKSEKRRPSSVDDDHDPKDMLNLNQSNVWGTISQLVVSAISDKDPVTSLDIVATFLKSAVKLVGRCLKTWPQSVVTALDSKIVSTIISTLLGFVKMQPQGLGESSFFPVVKHLITLTYDDVGQDYQNQLHCLAGLVGHTYLEVLDVRQSDLKLGKFAQDLLSLCQRTTSQRNCTQNNDAEIVYLLSMMARDICPKWRTAVVRSVMSKTPEAAVRCLPFLIANVGGSTGVLAKEFIQSLNKTSNQVSGEEVGRNSGILVCCLAKTVKVTVCRGSEEEVELKYVCARCNHVESNNFTRKQKGSIVEFQDIQPLFKLIGHQDPSVRSGLLELVTPLCTHSYLTNSAATLLLTFMHDPQPDIRNSFSHLIGNLLECECSTLEGRDQVSVSIVDRLAEMAPVGKTEEELESYVSTLVTAYQSILPQQCQTKILDLFLGMFFDPDRHQVCKKHCFLILKDALLKEKTHILHWCAEHMCSNGKSSQQIEPEQVVQYLNQLVPQEEVGSFLVENLHHLLPIVFQQSALKGLKKPIQTIASLKGIRPKALVHDYFTKIYAHIVINCDDKQFDTCIKHLKRETALDLVGFLNCYRLKSIEELLCVFSCNRDKVIKALRTCASVDESFKAKVPGEIDANKVKQYLSYNNNLMATLSWFLVKLSSASTASDTKFNIVASLAQLCNFLGPQYLAPVKHAMLACLKTVNNLTRKCPAFRTSCVTLWDAFVKNINLADIEIILPQVLVGLSMFIVMDKERVLALYKHLLVTHVNKFKDIKSLLVLLPDTQELKEIQQKVYGSKVEFRTLLQSIIHHIDHEAVEVRQQTLNMLKNLLETNMGALQGLLLRSDQTDSVVTELLEKLMVSMSSREPDEAVRYIASECIGRIGAVDPGKLELETGTSKIPPSVYLKENRDYILDINSVQFCVRLLQELVKASQSSRESNHHNTCMFSLQSIVKIYEINTKQRNSFAEKVFNELSDSHREIVYTVMNSNYAHQPTSQPEITLPVYGSPLGSHYKTWLVNFSQFLTQQVYDPKVKEMFVSCVPVMKKDASIAEFLLPHLVIAVVSAGGEEGINTVLLEINSVFSDADSTDDVKEKFVEGNTDMMVAHTLFSVLDHANVWLQAKYGNLLASFGKSESQLRVEELQRAARDKHYSAVKTFLTRISNESLANLSFYSGAYHRAAFYLDQTLNAQDLTDSQLNALQTLYAGLEEPDLVVGVAAMRSGEPSLDSQILYNTAIGNYQDALCCFERQGDTDPMRLIRCYLNIDQPALAARLAAGIVARDQTLERELAPFRAEAAWQLGEWQQLENFTGQSELSLQLPTDMSSQSGSSLANDSWEMGLSKTILAAHKGDRELFFQEVEKTRVLVLKTISAVSYEQGAYRKTYPQIGRLAMLREVEHIADKILLVKPGEKTDILLDRLSNILEELDARLNYAQVSWSNLEPMLRLRRGMFGAALSRFSTDVKLSDSLRCEIGECWLKSSRIARKAGQLQESYSYLLEAEKYQNPKLFLESASLKWKRNKRTEAISTLKKGLQVLFPDVMEALALENDPGSLSAALVALDNQKVGLKDLCAQGYLLLARYVEEAASVGQEGIKKYYDSAKDIVKNSNEVFYYLAKFMDKKSIKMTPDQTVNQSEIVSLAALSYLRSMRYGPTFLDECMPRLLTIWLDFAATIQDFKAAKNKDSQQVAVLDHATKQLSRLNKSVTVTRVKIPTYYFLTSFPQIVSRICHTNTETYLTLKSLIVQVFLGFPQQAAWHMVSVSKNRDTTRKSRCKEVFQEVIQQKPSLKTFLTDAVSFSQKIDDLCDANTGDRVVESSFKELLPSLPAMFQSREMSPIILPIERNMLVNIPTSLADLDAHNPFPSGCVTIQSVEDKIQIMVSLVKPKRITFRGSDGKLYSFLAKPRDDLRRDCRLMDLGSLLNRMFRKEPEARKRGLKMRTYMVVPTNETSGLIEWVHNLKGMRHILIHLLKERGVSLNAIQKRYQPRFEDTPERKEEFFIKCIEEMKGKDSLSPAVFREWFIRTFPDPQAWFAARLAFTRTTAVMSIMGYILGLGDRHLENINLDTATGDTFHVDMNSLFNVSESYKVPEIVPFRLTHNQVDGFGPLGVEGTYRKSCEVSLSMMREQKDLLMSVLRPFIFDPLVDWTVRDKSKKKDRLEGEGMNKPGQEALARVQDRLDGLVHSDKKRKGNLHSPLSVEGQVDHVIKEAMSIHNLALMYWGWAPFL